MTTEILQVDVDVPCDLFLVASLGQVEVVELEIRVEWMITGIGLRSYCGSLLNSVEKTVADVSEQCS